MRVVIQRVVSANATADGKIISSIGKGLCVLVGISRNDSKSDIEYIVRKILNLRLFEDTSGKRWSKSIKDCNGEILCLSQVTLYHSLKGNKPDFHHAMPPEKGKQFFNEFLEHIKSEYKPELVKQGIFGANLVIGIQNDGPVTITLESPSREESKDSMEEACAVLQNTKPESNMSSQTIRKQDSTSSQTCIIRQDSSYSQTSCSFDASSIDTGTSSSQTHLVKQDSTSSQTCIIKQDSTSSQTNLVDSCNISFQTGMRPSSSESSSLCDQDSKSSQTTDIRQNNNSSQTQLIKQDSVSSQTCFKLQDNIASTVTTQTPPVTIT